MKVLSEKMQQIFRDIMQFKIPRNKNKNYSVKSKIAKEDYLQSIKKLQEHIQRREIFMKSTLSRIFLRRS